MTRTGIVYFVGAGPGDPELITLRGVRAIQQADVILHDYLVNPALLQHASQDVTTVCLGSHGRRSLWSPEQIQARIVADASAGRTVVRLKSGDPMVFGRAASELESVSAAGIPFEIVPGVTAGLAAAAYAGVAVTNRATASAVALVTGQENPDKVDSQIDFAALAAFPGTLVFYMGVTSAGSWTHKLMQEGMSADRPVTLVRRCGWPDQSVICCRLDEVAEAVTPYRKFPPPVVAVVGAAADARWNWFEKRPLFGQTVVVTRPRDQAQGLVSRLQELGADVILQPAIEIQQPPSWQSMDQALAQLDQFDGIVFSSVNGVEGFMRRFLDRAPDVRRLAHLQLAGVGPATVAALEQYHLAVDVQPRQHYDAEAVLDLLKAQAMGRRYLIVRGTRGREVVARGLRAAGADVVEAVAYASVDVAEIDPVVAERFQHGDVNWITATSAAIASSAARLMGDRTTAKWAAISDRTADALRTDGLSVDCVAQQATVDSLVEAIVRSVQSGKD